MAIPALHGGAVAAIIDHCGGLCAWSGLNDIAKTVGTVDLRVDYLQPACVNTSDMLFHFEVTTFAQLFSDWVRI